MTRAPLEGWTSLPRLVAGVSRPEISFRTILQVSTSPRVTRPSSRGDVANDRGDGITSTQTHTERQLLNATLVGKALRFPVEYHGGCRCLAEKHLDVSPRRNVIVGRQRLEHGLFRREAQRE